MSTENPPYYDESPVAAAPSAARDRQKKSTMACEMCRKRKVKCIFSDASQMTCNFCAKYSFQCVVNTARKRRGPRPRSKQSKTVRSPTHDTSPSHTVEDEVNLRDRVSMSSPISDLEDYSESPPITWERDRDEGTFIWVLDQLSSIEFDLPMGVNEGPEVVRHCLTLFFTHINFQQYEFLDGAAFLRDLKAGVVQPCLINAIFSIHPSLISQPRYMSGAAFAAAAREQCHLDRPIFRLYIIQTLTILVLYFFSVNEGAQAWLYLGTANRIAQIISLKVDPDVAKPHGIPEASQRELKAFVQIAKTLYVMERLMISGTPSRPFTLTDMDFFFDSSEVRHESPVILSINSPVDDPTRITDESPHIIQLLSIWEQISLFEREGFVNLDPPPWNSRSRFQKLRQILDDWMLRLPRDLQFSSETLALRLSVGKGAQLVFLHCLFHHCNIILNRVFLPLLPWQQEFKDAPTIFLRERQNKCINSAASITMIIIDAFRSKSFIMPPFMGYCIFQSSIVHIHQSFCTTDETAAEVKNDLKINLQVLLTIKQFYKPADTWCTTIREMYEVHLEWQTRICPIGVASLTRQFRRYFDRFEGRIKEPPFAIYDDLAYTQGSPPERYQSHVPQDTSNVGAMVTGPDLEEYRERLRGFAMDLGKEDGPTQSGGEQRQSADLGDLYNIPMLPDQEHLSGSYANMAEDSASSNPEHLRIPESGYQTTLAPASQSFSPFALASIHSVSSRQSGTAGAQFSEELPDFTYDEEFGFENFDDVFGEMPEMPSLDGVIDQEFLEFLEMQQ